MAQPPPYNRQYNFQNWQTENPNLPPPGDQLDLEFNSIKITTDGIETNLALIQRDDGRLANGSVGRDQLDASVPVGFAAPRAWSTGVSYKVNDTVFASGKFYLCLVSHVSGTFATDLANGDWVLLADLTTITATLAQLAATQIDVASASVCDIGAASTFRVRVTGTTQINSFGSTGTNQFRLVVFQSAVQITNGTNLVLPQGAMITTRAGDYAMFIQDGTGVNWTCVAYIRADGSPLYLSAAEVTIASGATVDLGSAASLFVAISGSATVTSFGAGINQIKQVRLTGAVQLNNGANLVLPTGANIVGAAGDTFTAISDASAVWRVRGYQRVDGQPVALVTNARLATVATQTLKGRATAGSGSLEDLLLNDGLIAYAGTPTLSLNLSLTPQGYLSPVSGVIISAGDVTTSTIYWTPDFGCTAPIWDGITVKSVNISELSCALVAAHTVSTAFDCFLVVDVATIRLVTGPAWASVNSRGSGAGTTELIRLNNNRHLVNANSITGRYGSNTITVPAGFGTYVGTIFTDSIIPGQVTCHRTYGQSRKWGIWNKYNRRRIYLKGGDPGASWVSAPAAWHFSNNNLANAVSVFVGDTNQSVDVSHIQRGTFAAALTNSAAGTAGGAVGIGLNNSAAPVGTNSDHTGGWSYSLSGGIQLALSGPQMFNARYCTPLPLGLTIFNGLEFGAASGTVTLFGTEIFQLLSAWFEA